MGVIIGIDPHKSSHTAVALVSAGQVLGELRVTAGKHQIRELQTFTKPWPDRRWAVEGANGQDGRCPICREFLLYADHQPQSPREWERWLAVTPKAMTKQYIVAQAKHGTPDKIRLTHAHCHRRHTADNGDSSSAQPAREPSGLA